MTTDRPAQILLVEDNEDALATLAVFIATTTFEGVC